MRVGGDAVLGCSLDDCPEYLPAVPEGAQVARPVVTGRFTARDLRRPEAGMMRLNADLRLDFEPARAQVQAIDCPPAKSRSNHNTSPYNLSGARSSLKFGTSNFQNAESASDLPKNRRLSCESP